MAKNQTPKTYTLNEIFAMIAEVGVVGIRTPSGRMIEADYMELYQAGNGETLIRFVGTNPQNSASFRIDTYSL